MKGQTASILIVVALIIGAGIGYFGNTVSSKTTTETTIKTYTITTTLPGESGVEQCVVTDYTVWEVLEVAGSSTIQTTSIRSNAVQTYQTSTSVEQTIGFETTTTASYTGTLTGAVAIWNSTTCTFISG